MVGYLPTEEVCSQALRLKNQLQSVIKTQLQPVSAQEQEAFELACQQLEQDVVSADVIFVVADMLGLVIHVVHKHKDGERLQVDSFEGEAGNCKGMSRILHMLMHCVSCAVLGMTVWHGLHVIAVMIMCDGGPSA